MLERYRAEGGPHSGEVREALTDLGRSFVAHNPRRPDGEVLNAGTRDEMVAIGGEDQIPLLVDHRREEIHYGSDEIVDYLADHYG